MILGEELNTIYHLQMEKNEDPPRQENYGLEKTMKLWSDRSQLFTFSSYSCLGLYFRIYVFVILPLILIAIFLPIKMDE